MAAEFVAPFVESLFNSDVIAPGLAESQSRNLAIYHYTIGLFEEGSNEYNDLAGLSNEQILDSLTTASLTEIPPNSILHAWVELVGNDFDQILLGAGKVRAYRGFLSMTPGLRHAIESGQSPFRWELLEESLEVAGSKIIFPLISARLQLPDGRNSLYLPLDFNPISHQIMVGYISNRDGVEQPIAVPGDFFNAVSSNIKRYHADMGLDVPLLVAV